MKMDEASRKKSGRINVLNNSGEDYKVKRNADGIEYEEVEIWSEEWQCNICGVAQKRSRSRSRSRSQGEDDEQDRPTKAPRHQETAKGEKGKGRGKQPGGPCWMCGGPHFQRECPNLGKRWTAVPKHYGVDQEVFQTGSSTMELLASQATQRKRQGKAQRQRKRRKRRQRKRKGPVVYLGDRHLATCRTGTRTVTRQSWCSLTSKAGRR